MQNFVESIVEFVDDNVKSSFHSRNALVAPLTLTIFVWVWLMNLMDLIPVDWVPYVATQLGVPYLKIVPTTDVNVTMGMSLSVFGATRSSLRLVEARLRLTRRTSRKT